MFIEALTISLPLWWIAYECYLYVKRTTREPVEETDEMDASSVEDAIAKMPDSLRNWIDSESESWAREEMLEVAVRYYGIFDDWGQAEIAVKRAYGQVR